MRIPATSMKVSGSNPQPSVPDINSVVSILHNIEGKATSRLTQKVPGSKPTKERLLDCALISLWPLVTEILQKVD
jgi:hypothetical protein